jgi:hypothetical protein
MLNFFKNKFAQLQPWVFWLLVALLVLVIATLSIIYLSKNGSENISFIKNLFNFGK